jgi:DNA-binding transcriptional regulator YiaG
MTAGHFRAALERLDLTQGEAAEFFGVSIRTAHAWANNGAPIPEAVAKLLRLMQRLNLKPSDVR